MMIVHLSESIDEIKRNWSAYRCNPVYMPFVGFIRDDISVTENFYFCTNQFGSEILKAPLDEVQSMMGTTADAIAQAGETANQARGVISGVRSGMMNFASSTVSKAAGSTSMFVYYLVKIRDIFKRFVSQGYIGAYLVNVVFSFVESFALLFVNIVKIFIFAMLAISFVLALFQPELLAIVIFLAVALSKAGA